MENALFLRGFSTEGERYGGAQFGQEYGTERVCRSIGCAPILGGMPASYLQRTQNTSLIRTGANKSGAYLSEVILILLNVHQVRRERESWQQFPEHAVDIAVEHQDSTEQNDAREHKQVRWNYTTYSAKVEVVADLPSDLLA